MPSRGESDGDQAVHGVPADVNGDLAPAAFRHGLGQLGRRGQPLAFSAGRPRLPVRGGAAS